MSPSHAPAHGVMPRRHLHTPPVPRPAGNRLGPPYGAMEDDLTAADTQREARARARGIMKAEARARAKARMIFRVMLGLGLWLGFG